MRGYKRNTVKFLIYKSISLSSKIRPPILRKLIETQNALLKKGKILHVHNKLLQLRNKQLGSISNPLKLTRFTSGFSLKHMKALKTAKRHLQTIWAARRLKPATQTGRIRNQQSWLEKAHFNSLSFLAEAVSSPIVRMLQLSTFHGLFVFGKAGVFVSCLLF